MFCEHCGNELKEGATRCNWCGTPVSQGVSHEAEQDDISQNTAASNPSEPDTQEHLNSVQNGGEEPKKKKRRWRRNKQG